MFLLFDNELIIQKKADFQHINHLAMLNCAAKIGFTSYVKLFEEYVIQHKN